MAVKRLLLLLFISVTLLNCANFAQLQQHNNTTTTVLRPFVWDYPGEPVPEETLTHPPS